MRSYCLSIGTTNSVRGDLEQSLRSIDAQSGQDPVQFLGREVGIDRYADRPILSLYFAAMTLDHGPQLGLEPLDDALDRLCPVHALAVAPTHVQPALIHPGGHFQLMAPLLIFILNLS